MMFCDDLKKDYQASYLISYDCEYYLQVDNISIEYITHVDKIST